MEDAGLRHLPGPFLKEIVRAGDLLAAVDARQQLVEGDRLVFVGDVTAMVDLQRTPGLAVAPDQVFELDGDRTTRRIVEAVVAERNPLVGRTLRDGGLCRRYQAVVIAVAHAGDGGVPGCGAMLLTRCCALEEARRALDLTVLVAIAAAFGLARAMPTTSLDRALADMAVRPFPCPFSAVGWSDDFRTGWRCSARRRWPGLARNVST